MKYTFKYSSVVQGNILCYVAKAYNEAEEFITCSVSEKSYEMAKDSLVETLKKMENLLPDPPDETITI